MELADIKQFIEDNKDNQEVNDYIQGLAQVTPETIESFLESDGGKKILQPRLDKYHSKSLETWKANNLEKLVNEELNKRNPSDTPEQQRIAELEKYVQQKEQESIFQTNKNKALNYLNDKKLPSNLVDYFISDDEETTMQNLGRFEDVFTNQLQEAVESRLKSDGTELSNNESKEKTFTKEQVQAMSTNEINENWEDIKDAIGQED